MRRFLPRTLPAWVLLIVIAGLMASQVATLSIVSRDRASTNETVELYRLNDRAFSLVKLMYGEDPDARKALAAGLSNAAYGLNVSESPAVTSSIPADDTLAELDDIIVSRLSRFGILEARVKRERARRDSRGHDGAPEEDSDIGAVEQGLLSTASDFSRTDRLMASIEFKDGQWLNFVVPMTPVGPVLTPQSLPLYGTTAALIVVMSIWAVRRLTAPYRLLENAVRRIGEDLKSPPLAEEGSAEYRSAAHAINTMQAKLLEYVEDREHLAAALAHDLRTPITRMRLRLELLADPSEQKALAQNLEEIESISRSVIDFAKFEYSEEKAELVDVWSLVDSIAELYPEARFEAAEFGPRDLVCRVRPIGLRRCITNLVDNAVTYGKTADIGLARTEDDIILSIVDDGPGIPEEKLGAVFQAFVRVEASRNRETGGSGLGLTIARNFMRSIGGEVTLSNEPGRGLRTTVRLPRIAL